ncbi:uncharacterized protein LOC142947482 [Anarhichas minor]|uniref:uncharacterized protein LOC142947482 n=1 Tax=Anarhichas minor TaxID=65739 RepID=UPI003F7315EE
MSVFPDLREFVNERLTVAADEIFEVFKNAIVEYEEEIQRQRRLLDIVWKPEVKLHRIELPQQHVFQEDEVLSDQQQLCVLVRNSSLDQEDPEPPQIKVEQEQLCTSEEGERLVLKQETDDFVIPINEESGHSDDDHSLNSHSAHEAESQDPIRDEHGDSGSTSAEPKQQTQHHKGQIDSNNVCNPTKSTIHCNTRNGRKVFTCDICGKSFKYKAYMQRHRLIHSDDRPYSCEICGKRFRYRSYMQRHRMIHTDEKPYSCEICGTYFRSSSHLIVHMRTHTGERPYLCKTCGKRFSAVSTLNTHQLIHTGEKPYVCKTCGRAFRLRDHLRGHMRTHTD